MGYRVNEEAERGDQSRNRLPRARAICDEGIFHALLSPGPVEDAEMLPEIKARIRRSIDDPRPSLSLNQVDDFIDALVVKARADGRRA